MRYTFWNNKGGTGKSSLAFQTITEYAILHPTERILAIDLCPQANLSELFMGGLLGNGGVNLGTLTTPTSTCTIGGYFQDRLSTPYNVPTINPALYTSNPSSMNNKIPVNIDLIAGDRIVELQSNSISALSITQIPGIDTYLKVIDWGNDLINASNQTNNYDAIFIDTNPSFAIYTQIALAATDRIIAPVMADDSSRRALTNIFSLVYGLNLPSAIYNTYAFNTKLANGGRPLPKIHLVVKNRLTQYMGPASAYASVLTSIDNDLNAVLATHPQYFTFTNLSDGLVDVRDFQTTGVVAFAEATPFSRLAIGNHNIFGQYTQIQHEYLTNCVTAINRIVTRL
ncbi:MAG TPA: ParA family protein [Ignavibacteria bacterium]